MENFNKFMELVKLEYFTDTSWSYKYEDNKHIIQFYQDESGKNHVEQFAVCKKNVWIELLPTDEQVKAMYEKLNNTEYQGVLNDDFLGDEEIIDLYNYNGVKRSDFI